MTSPRDCEPCTGGAVFGGPPGCGISAQQSLSKMLIWLFACQRASCWNANATLSGTAKSLALPPSVHRIAPVVALILYSAHVLRIDTSQLPSGATSIELMWYGS